MSHNYKQSNMAKSGEETQSSVRDILGVNNLNIKLLKSSIYC